MRYLKIFSLVLLLIFPSIIFAQAINIYNQDKPSVQVVATPVTSANELQKSLDQKRKAINQLEKQILQYQKVIEKNQGQAATLENQLSLLRNKMAKTELDIQATQDKIDENNLNSKQLQDRINETNKKIYTEKETLTQLLQAFNSQDDQNLIEILLKEQQLSEFLDALTGTQALGIELQKSIEKLNILQQQHQLEQAALEQKQQQLTELQKALKDNQDTLTDEQSGKETLIVQTRLSENKYQKLLSQARQEQLNADKEIRTLEQTIREQLLKESRGRYNPNVHVSLVWPVPNQGIAAYFHDPSYIFRKVFEHPAVDIRTLINGTPSNGMPVRAAASGYVGIAKNAGMGYSYVMIIHNSRISTVYGHLSRIDVSKDTYVTQGQVIGLSGGKPGTPGAGNMTTGPHLHFEVRVDGLPANPLDYLP